MSRGGLFVAGDGQKTLNVTYLCRRWVRVESELESWEEQSEPDAHKRLWSRVPSFSETEGTRIS